MNLTLPDATARDVRNLSARYGCRPVTCAKAALRRGLKELTIEDVEAEMNPKEREKREAREALAALEDPR